MDASFRDRTELACSTVGTSSRCGRGDGPRNLWRYLRGNGPLPRV